MPSCSHLPHRPHEPRHCPLARLSSGARRDGEDVGCTHACPGDGAVWKMGSMSIAPKCSHRRLPSPPLSAIRAIRPQSRPQQAVTQANFCVRTLLSVIHPEPFQRQWDPPLPLQKFEEHMGGVATQASRHHSLVWPPDNTVIKALKAPPAQNWDSSGEIPA
jgi:hypothetical protein